MKVELKLILIEKDKNTAKNIVENHHSYVPTFKSVGRRLDWLIFVDNEVKGMIGVGSSTYPPCKDVFKKNLILTRRNIKKFLTTLPIIGDSA